MTIAAAGDGRYFAPFVRFHSDGGDPAMFVRATLVAAAAALMPLTAAPAQASCLDDATGRSLAEGYSGSPKSQYYAYGYVETSGTATVVFHGDELVSDYSLVAGDWVRYASTIGANTADITTDFVNCVAG